MADDTTLVPTPTSRRARLLAQRRRRRRRFLVALSVATVALGTAGAFALAGDDEPGEKRAASPAPDVSVAAGEGGPVATIPADDVPQPPRVISHDAPLRLWIGGDSLAGALGPALGEIAGATGVVDAQLDYRVSSGIADDGVRDWSERAAEQMTLYDPEAIVFEIGTNDASIVNDRTNADGAPEWEPAYRVQVARMMDVLRGDDENPRTVLWVGAPPMRTEWRDEGVRELNRVMREEAAKRSPDVTYVDAYALLADEDGEYTDSVPTLSGAVERVRISDGVHLTAAGAEYLAAVLYAMLDARWEIERHADRSQPIGWSESSGSGGGSSGSGSGSGSGSSGSGGSGGDGGSDGDDPGSGDGGGTADTAPAATTPPVAPSAPATNPPATTAAPATPPSSASTPQTSAAPASDPPAP
jgi:hypothetical protein